MTIELFNGRYGYTGLAVNGERFSHVLIYRDNDNPKFCGQVALNAAIKHATDRGLLNDPPEAYTRKGLLEWLRYLDTYAEHRTEQRTCLLARDSWAPFSFAVSYLLDGAHWWNGGLIYHGSRDGAIGSESMSVRVGPDANEEWSIHT